MIFLDSMLLFRLGQRLTARLTIIVLGISPPHRGHSPVQADRPQGLGDRAGSSVSVGAS